MTNMKFLFLKRAKSVLKKIIKKYFKLWGVEIQVSEIDPEFVVTFHARERLLERLKCSDRKLKKIAIKAWYSSEQIDVAMVNRKQYRYRYIYGKKKNIYYRQFLGRVFVWEVVYRTGQPQKILITMF